MKQKRKFKNKRIQPYFPQAYLAFRNNVREKKSSVGKQYRNEFAFMSGH